MKTCFTCALLVSVMASTVRADDAPAPLSPVACLRKMALDLTARGPGADEVAAVRSGARPLSALADQYLASPDFGAVLYDWMRERFAPGRDSPPKVDYEEPSRIARRIVLEDRDLRELVTADWTVGPNGAVAPVTGKPAAGVLSTQHLMSAEIGILRRRWAGRMVRDFTGIALSPATIPPDGDPDISRAALARNPSCMACHANPIFGLDGVATFTDCWRDDGTYKAGCKEPQGRFLGQPGVGLSELGRITAGSPELASQLVNLFAARLLGRPLAREETALYVQAVRVLQASGYRARPLLRFLVTSPAYCER